MLYLVPTPIGNLEDITLRAIRILREVDLIVCEDTRHTIKLLNHFQINKKLISFFTYNQLKRIPYIIDQIKAGKKVALVSDSGTPGISDPGYYLVKRAIQENIPITSLPGANAILTALVSSGLPCDSFVFLGFLQRKTSKIKKELIKASSIGKTIIFYESPYRIKKTLSVLEDIFKGEVNVVLARELTKKFEEFIRGRLKDVISLISDRNLKGEIVVLIYPNKEA